MGHLAAAPQAEHEQLVLELVRAQAASVLGHPSADAVDGWRGFLELGFDSLTAVELRNQLNATTGLRLAATVVFDFATPVALTRHLLAELDAARRAASTTTAITTAAGGGLSDLYHQAMRDGKSDEFLKLMKKIAEFRPSYEDESAVHPVRISRGAVQPGLICFPAFVGKADVYQYARLAAKFRGVRDVAVLPQPGFGDGEPLPASADALIRSHASAVRECAAGLPFVLLGYSAGGLIAHAVAAHLETLGLAPAAVVLIDTYSPEDAETWLQAKSGLEREMMARNDEPQDVPGGDSWVTAMGRYFSFDWWNLREIAAPTLVVRATESIITGEDSSVSWRCAQTVTTLDAPGNHFSVIREHAEFTAEAIQGWLTSMFQPRSLVGPRAKQGS
jgi:pimeloyl-ACP methyl ester carboxylesterase